MDTFIEQVELLVSTPGGTTTKTNLTAKTKRYGGEDPFKAAEKHSGAFAPEAGPPSPPAGYRRKQKQQRKKPSLLRRLFCCCVSGDSEYSLHEKKQTEAELRAAAAAVVEDTVARPARAHKNKRESRVLFETTPPTPPLPMMYPNRKTANSALVKRTNNNDNLTVVGKGTTPNSGIYDPSAKSGTEFHSYIPSHLSETTQARLRAELSKPFSEGDEPGYIYVFWLTDSPLSSSSTPGAGKQTTAAALLKAATAAESLPRGTTQKPRLLLKIGRANNVQRRLHEWSTQCGYNLSLVRFYPHVSASSTPSSTPGSNRSTPLSTPALSAQVGKKVPNSHRIEHLIHLELRDNATDNPEIDCEACGKIHKEWFWVDASREGLRNVDEIVKKWIDYGEQSVMVAGPSSTQNTLTQKTPKASPKNTDGTPKKSKKQDDPVTPTPAQKRSTPKGAPADGAQGKKTPSSHSVNTKTTGNTGRQNLSPNGGGAKRISASPARNTGRQNLSPNGGGAKRVSASPARSNRSDRSNGGSRPGSSAGKSKSPNRGRGGGWKNYDENEGSEEYRPDQDE
jgi:hypothetical protein